MQTARGHLSDPFCDVRIPGGGESDALRKKGCPSRIGCAVNSVDSVNDGDAEPRLPGSILDLRKTLIIKSVPILPDPIIATFIAIPFS